MDTDDKPKVRVVKAGKARLKSGVMRSEGDGGTVYRGPCDRCQTMVTTRKPPYHDSELLCKSCIYVARVGKSSTRVKRKGDRVLAYYTDCDICGDVGKTPFLPKKGRPYLCDLCYKEEVKVKREEEQVKWEAGREEREERAEAAKAEAEAGHDDDITLTLELDESPLAVEGGPEPEAATVSEPEQTRPPREPTPAPEPVRYMLTCRRCKSRLSLKFRPAPGERFICPSCYEKESAREERKKETPSTRLLFNIECAFCGKDETVDFVPNSLSETICTECFDKRRRT